MVASSPQVLDSDRVAMEISDPVDKRSKKEENIKEKCYADATSIRNGDYNVECRSTNDAKRSGRPKGTTHVEVAVLVVASDGALPKKINPDTFVWRVTSTKARFLLHLGGDNVGSTAYLFFRWINDKYPNLPGPWSNMTSFPIA